MAEDEQPQASDDTSEPPEEPEEPEEPQKQYPCPECDQSFDTAGALNFHNYTYHVKPNQPKDETCSMCGAGPYTKSDLKSHVKRKHKGDRMRDKSDPSPEPVETPDSPESETDDDEPVFKGPRADAIRRRQRLEQAIGVFDMKEKIRNTILKVWDTYETVRTDEREFYDFIYRLDGVEPDMARRIVDLVFGGRTSSSAPPPYYPHSPREPPYSNPPYSPPYESRRYTANYSNYYPEQPPYYQPAYPPQYPPMPQRSDPNLITREEHELQLKISKQESELDRKEREMDDLKARLERIEQNPPNPVSSGLVDDKDKQIERLERKIDDVQRQRDAEVRDQRMDSRMKMIESRLGEVSAAPDRMLDSMKRQGLIGQPQGMSDTAQVQMKELDTKLGVFTKSVDDLKDIAKTWMTLGQPMRRSGSPLTDDERELARRELSG